MLERHTYYVRPRPHRHERGTLQPPAFPSLSNILGPSVPGGAQAATVTLGHPLSTAPDNANWLQYRLPNGQSYYFHTQRRVSTDADLGCPKSRQKVTDYLRNILGSDSAALKEPWELWLRSKPNAWYRLGSQWRHSLINHHSRRVIGTPAIRHVVQAFVVDGTSHGESE